VATGIFSGKGGRPASMRRPHGGWHRLHDKLDVHGCDGGP
jgi:hypothetical protein